MSLEREVFNTLCVYRELGVKFARLEKFGESLNFFDRALKKKPDDKRALRNRATCRAKTFKYNDALKDMAAMYAIDPDNIYVATTDCHVKYLCSEFEDAMIHNLRKMQLRKKPDNFVMGAMHCKDAIQNNIGVRTGNPLRDHFRIIRKLAWLRQYEKMKPAKRCQKHKKKKKEMKEEEKLYHLLAAPNKNLLPAESKERNYTKKSISSRGSSTSKTGIKMHLLEESSSIMETLSTVTDNVFQMPPLKDYPFKPIQPRTSNIQNFMAERYLEKMYQDKIFMYELPYREGVHSPNEKGEKKIIELAKKSAKYIHYNQELLRARRPFYFIRLHDSKISGKLKERQMERQNTLMEQSEKDAKYFIDKIKQGISTQNMRQVTEVSEKLLYLCEITPKNQLPHRQEYLQTLYKLMRDAYFYLNYLDKALTKEKQNARIALLMGLSIKENGSKDDLVLQFADYFVDEEKRCGTYERRVRKSIDKNEVVWFYYELSSLYFKRKKFEIAKGYAIKCLRESYSLKDDKWIINAIFKIINVLVATKNKNGTKIELGRCRNIAKKMNDQKLDKFLERCIEVIDKTQMDVDNPLQIIEARTKNIMRLLTSETTIAEAKMIFQRIARLPPSKRMSVIPGVIYPFLEESTKHEITVSSKSDNKIQELRKIKKTHSKREAEVPQRGVQFLKLLEYYKM